MRRVLWRGFVSRRLRSSLTGIAIALGVALMAGTYVLTDTINSSFAGIFSSANHGNDVVVVPRQVLGQNTTAETSPIDDAMLARVRSGPGVAKAAGDIFSPAAFLTNSGQRITKQAPAFVTAPVPKPFESFSTVQGRFPVTSTEVSLDQSTADRAKLRVGDTMQIAGSGPASRYRIVGILKFAGSQSFGGAGAAMLTLSEAQQTVGKIGEFDTIDVASQQGVSPTQLRNRLRTVLPATIDVRTGSEEAAQQTSNLKSNLGFLRTFLLIFAYVSLVVGAFIIFNTFSITVTQRTREFALLRTLGASRKQIMSSVVVEGLLLGLLGSALGLVAGIFVAPGLDQLFKAFGADLPDTGAVLLGRTVLVSLALGTSVTVLAGLLPALRATRVPPIAAMRDDVEIPPRQPLSRGRYAIPILLGIVVVRIVIALISSRNIGTAIVILVVIAAVAIRLRQRSRGRHYRVIPIMARLTGALVAWRGITGHLARENASRQPGRTAVTAGALTIGLILVTLVSILASGLKASINQAVDQSFGGALIVDNTQSGQGQGIPAAVAPAVSRVRGVKTVAPLAFTTGKVNTLSKNSAVTAIDPRSFSQIYKIQWDHGSDSDLQSLGSEGTILTKNFADKNHFRVGQTLSVLTPSDHRVRLTVRGIATDNARLLAGLTITLPLARTAFGQTDDAIDFVSYTPGVTNAEVQPRVNRILRAQFPQAQSQTTAQFEQSQAGQINSLLTLIYVLLALSVIVALFGIVNTLILSIYERRRELGMMRAIGTTRQQVRQMIRYESVITALIGGILGMVIGLIAGILASVALRGRGFVLSVPIGTLIVLLVVSGIAGVVASLVPARRAARLDPLAALAAQ